MMRAHILPDENVDYLDDLLFDDKGRLQVVPAAALRAHPQVHLSIWGNKRGVYCFPTDELIEWLRERIAGRPAIEICSGNGAIGRALNIPRTDSYNQTTPQMLAYYKLYNQTPIFPPEDVQKFEANEAVDHFKPEVVIGSYVTQKYIPSDEGVVGSSLFGVDEIALIPKVKCYITIGNESSHGDKRICQRAHRVFRVPWLFTRSMEPENNGIYVWGA